MDEESYFKRIIRINLKIILFIFVFFLIATAGCLKKDLTQFNETKEKFIEIKDDFGYTVVVKKYPKRIVSLSPANTEILFALGLKDRVVGVTEQCNYPPEVLEMKKKGEIESIGGYSSVNVEKVLALNPDLVIASYGNGIECIEAIKGFGIPVICLNPKNITEIIEDIKMVAKVTGTEKHAEKLEKYIINEIEYIKAKLKATKARPRVAHVIWYNPIWVSGKNTFVDELIQLAGGQNAFNKSGWTTVSLEEFLVANPEIIIVNSGTGMEKYEKNLIYEWITTEELLKDVKAIKNGRIYVIDADIISRPSYRLIYALKEIARFIHPEVFEKMENFINTSYYGYYNLSNSSYFWLNQPVPNTSH